MAKSRNEGTTDRRTRRRFDMEQPLRYKLLYGDHLGETGSGHSRNMSSSGICFTADAALDKGTPVEVSLAWPAMVNDVCPMKLVIYGCVVRSDEQGVALSIERYEFRTRGNAPAPLYVDQGVRLPV